MEVGFDILVQVHDVLAAPLAGNPDGKILDAVKVAFPDPNIQRQAVLEAFILVTKYKSVRTARQFLLDAAALPLICRGMFYRAVVEGQGTTLDSAAVRRAANDKLVDCWDDFMGSIPIVGDLIGPVKSLVGLIAALVMKEQALERFQGSLAEQYELADEYIRTYNMAMAAWLDWGCEVVGALSSIMLSGFHPNLTD